MPEGPEVETIRRSLAPHVVGRRLGAPWVSKKALRTPIRPRDLLPLAERRVVGLDRHGKLLVVDVEGGAGLFVRLGMTGRLVVADAAAAREPHTHVVFPLDDGDRRRELRFIDARRFGEVVPFPDAAARAAEQARMGPDAIALPDDARPAVRAALRATKRALKDALLDQRLLAGVGNIYASEALHRAGLSPFARGVDLREDDAARLVQAVVDVLQDAVARRGTSFSDYVDGMGEAGENGAYLAVFQREGEPCPTCGAAVQRAVQGARSTFYCRRCQHRPRRRRSG